MNINGIGTQYQNYAVSGAFSTKRSNSESMADSFSKVIVNWEKRIKDAIDKERQNDSDGSIRMSEMQWRNLMKKVDNAINTFKDNQKNQETEGKRQLEEKKFIAKETVSNQTHKMETQCLEPKLVQTFGYTAFLATSGKRD
jgi:membrane-associated HD superfamily phosphohydrolase